MNPIHPKRTVDINGFIFPLRYEYRDFAKAEGRTKEALLGPPARSFWNCNLPAYMSRVLLFTGLLNCERQVCASLNIPYPMDMDDLMGFVTFENSGAIESAVADAVSEVFDSMVPKAETTPEAEAEQAAPLAQPSSGTESGPSL